MKIPTTPPFIEAVSEVCKHGFEPVSYDPAGLPKMDIRQLHWAVSVLAQDPGFMSPRVKQELEMRTMFAGDENLSFDPAGLFPRLQAGVRALEENCKQLLSNQGTLSGEAGLKAGESFKAIVLLSTLAHLFKENLPALKNNLSPQSNDILSVIASGALSKMHVVARRINDHAKQASGDTEIRH